MIQTAVTVAVASLGGCVGAPASDEGASEPSTHTERHDGGGDSESGHDEGGDSEGGHDEDGDSEGGHDDGGHGDGGEIGEPTETAAVHMVTNDASHHFDPHVVRVSVGGTVTFENESGSHSAAAYHPGNDQPQLVPDGTAAWESGLLTTSGATYEHIFDTEGVYHYYCAPHESVGMIGTVVVGDPDPHEQMALGEPPTDKPDTVQQKLRELNERVRGALGDDHD